MGTMFNGLLFFPITPYQSDGEVDVTELAAHVKRGVDAGAGGVFVACGTGEFSALEQDEYAGVVRAAVEAVAGRVPVFAGAGGPVRTARRFADRAKDAGADGILLLPPYLTEASGRGLVRYVRAATREDLPTIVYNRANARFDEDSAVTVAGLPQVIGFKDGAGDLDLMARIVRAVRDVNEYEMFPGQKKLLKETGQPYEKVVADTERNFWIGADEAVTYGLVGKVISSASEV